jgi:hypothetical protein
MTVRFPTFSLYLSMASYTFFSLALSRAEVASSRSKILGFFRKALAIAIRYFCPPESLPPPAPTLASIVSGNLATNYQAFASSKACLISESEALGLA